MNGGKNEQGKEEGWGMTRTQANIVIALLFGLLVVSFGHWAFVFHGSPLPAQWEYCVETLPDDDSLEDLLNRRAKVGWEFQGAFASRNGSSVILRRRR
jgi:hypothetical protein